MMHGSYLFSFFEILRMIPQKTEGQFFRCRAVLFFISIPFLEKDIKREEGMRIFFKKMKVFQGGSMDFSC